MKENNTQTHWEELCEKYQNFVFDCEGVLWMGPTPIQGSFKAIQYLRAKFPQKRIFFVTNNSTYSQAEAVGKKIQKWDKSAKAQEVLCSPYLISNYLRINRPNLKNVLCIGTQGLKTELKKAGFNCSANKMDEFKTGMTQAQFIQLSNNFDDPIDAVVVGIDYAFNYYKLCYATLAIKNGAQFYATNKDAFNKMPNGLPLPGPGTMINAIEMSTKTEALVFGKPNNFAGNLISQLYGIKAEETLMVGDSLKTDIKFAQNCGFDACFVLSGVNSRQDYQGQNDVIAKYIMPCLGTFRKNEVEQNKKEEEDIESLQKVQEEQSENIKESTKSTTEETDSNKEGDSLNKQS